MRFRILLLAAGFLSPLPAAVSPAQAAPPAKASAKGAKYDEARLKALEARLAKNPKDAKLKQETAEANYQVGYATMTNPDLGPRIKYRAALARFRRALALNPKHAKAANDKKMIEDIYRQMGRPIPQ